MKVGLTPYNFQIVSRKVTDLVSTSKYYFGNTVMLQLDTICNDLKSVIAMFLDVFFQISMNARLRSLVTPTPTAPTLQAPTSATARKGSRETARTVKVGLTPYNFQIVSRKVTDLVSTSKYYFGNTVMLQLDTICNDLKSVIAMFLDVFFQISMNARLRSLVTPTPTAPTLQAPTSVTARMGLS